MKHAPASTGNLHVWLNGRFLPSAQAFVSPFDRGFLYGDGLFETLRAERALPLYLDDHLERLGLSALELHIHLPDALDWQGLIRRLLRMNGLSDVPARVKILVSRGTEPGLGLPPGHQPTILISAEGYRPPEDLEYLEGWRLALPSQGYAPPLARHKSLNYLYYLLARQSALDAGFHEALIVDAGGNVAETAACSLLCRSKGHWWTPANPWQLPGVTLKQVRRLMCASGTRVEDRTVSPQDLMDADTVWLLNSLMGVMPVHRIGQQGVPELLQKEAAMMREFLLAGR